MGRDKAVAELTPTGPSPSGDRRTAVWGVKVDVDALPEAGAVDVAEAGATIHVAAAVLVECGRLAQARSATSPVARSICG